MNKQSKSQPLALTDWAANVEGISRDCETLLWELTLHHFLRDEVLVQDEALAQSARLADWFIGNAINQEYFRVLEELVEVGVVTVIVLDPMQYPEDLKEPPAFAIAARAAQIQRESRKHGEPFQLTAKQEHFHRGSTSSSRKQTQPVFVTKARIRKKFTITSRTTSSGS